MIVRRRDGRWVVTTYPAEGVQLIDDLRMLPPDGDKAPDAFANTIPNKVCENTGELYLLAKNNVMNPTFFLVLQGLDDSQGITQRCLASLGQSQGIVDQSDTVVDTEDRVLLRGLFGNLLQPVLGVEDAV